MTIENHLHLVPTIEKEIVDNRLDTLVLGLGPTGHLLPWLDRKITSGLRIWGCHDVARLKVPVDDLFVFDAPQERLAYGTDAFKMVVDARPKRMWFFDGNYKFWAPHLHHPMESVVRKVSMLVWQRGPQENGIAKEDWPTEVALDAERPHTLWISPTGMTTVAWREGCRRIGVLGVDCRKFEHHSYQWRKDLDKFFLDCAKQAHERGGIIKSLSPISSLNNFRAWSPSESSSDPTDASKSTEPKPSSNTASESTQVETT